MQPSVELQGINWDGINAHMVVAVQDLKADNDLLKTDNELLKSRTNEICEKMPEYNWSWC